MIQLALPLEVERCLAEPWPVPERRRPRPRLVPPQLSLPLGTVRALPATRGGCPGVRPCPFVSCSHHLLIDSVPAEGSVRINRHAAAVVRLPLLEWGADELEAGLAALPETCSLDVAERHGITQEETAEILGGWWRTRVEAIEIGARQKFARELLELAGEDGVEDFLEALRERGGD